MAGAWAGTTTLWRSWLYPSVRNLWIRAAGLLGLWHWQSDALTTRLASIKHVFAGRNESQNCKQLLAESEVAEKSSQIHSPLLGDKVDYGIGLSYWPASLSPCSLAGRYDSLIPEFTVSLQSGTKNWASVVYVVKLYLAEVLCSLPS